MTVVGISGKAESGKTTLENILKTHFKNSNVQVDEIALPIEESNLFLPCGVTGWITHE